MVTAFLGALSMLVAVIVRLDVGALSLPCNSNVEDYSTCGSVAATS